jgi:hypothetical protein
MLSDTLNDHIDNIDKLSEEIQDEIDKAISAIDVKALIYAPRETLLQTVEIIKKIMLEKYIPEAMSQGVGLSEKIVKEDIVVDLTKDADLNVNEG